MSSGKEGTCQGLVKNQTPLTSRPSDLGDFDCSLGRRPDWFRSGGKDFRV